MIDAHDVKTILRTMYHLLRWAAFDGKAAETSLWCSALAAHAERHDVELHEAFSELELADLSALFETAEKGVPYRAVNEAASNDLAPAGDWSSKNQIMTERELQDAIVCDRARGLVLALGTDAKLYDCECVTLHGRVDVVLRNASTVFPVELKSDLADHAVVGQALKYVEHFEKRLILNIWTRVQGAVVASRYTAFSLKELKRLGIATLVYRFDGRELSFALV